MKQVKKESTGKGKAPTLTVKEEKKDVMRGKSPNKRLRRDVSPGSSLSSDKDEELPTVEEALGITSSYGLRSKGEDGS